MKCATCLALTSMPTPKSSTPGLLLTIVRLRVPRACRARMRFSGRPHRPKPPHMTVAPSGMSATASAALSITLFMSVIILHQFGAPLCRRGENGFDRLAAPEITAQLCEARNETVQRVAKRICVRQTDIAPHVGRTRCESGAVDQSATSHPQTVCSSRRSDRLHERARGKLRKMTDIRHYAVMLFRGENAGPRAETAHKARQTFDGIR